MVTPSCTMAIQLAAAYWVHMEGGVSGVSMPKLSYVGVPAALLNAGVRSIKFLEIDWQGEYEIWPWLDDSALKRNESRWMTSKELAAEALIAERTARAHLARLVRLKMVLAFETFPGRRHKLAEKAEARNKAYFARLNRAIEAFGLG